MALASAQKLEQVASFFEERVEVVELKNGGLAYIQRPKNRPLAAVQSAADLPDNFDASIAAAAATDDTELWRVSFTPLEIIFKYQPSQKGIKISLKLVVPVIGNVHIGSASGSLNTGVALKIGYKKLAQGIFGIKYGDGTVTMYWDLSAFGKTYHDELNLFTV